MFHKGDEIVYPVQGAGKIVKIKDQKFCGEKTEYYEIKFTKTPLTISLPVDSSDGLGLREPTPKKELLKKLETLGKRVRIDPTTLRDVNNILKTKVDTGDIDMVIEAFNIFKAVSKKKRDENKAISYTSVRYAEIATSFIESEIRMVLGEKALDKYDLSI